jgi:phosphoribosyl 1,2-cyclic phosphate phosphodiesterase
MTKITLLGTGTSTGVPMIACNCKTCRSEDPRDKRLRVSVLIEAHEKTIVIDTSADFRQQMLSHKVKELDAVLYTHHHYDHIAGFDDLRAFQFLRHKAPMCYAMRETSDYIQQMFPYAFGKAVQAGGGLPKVPFTVIESSPFKISGLNIIPIPVEHGLVNVLGYRIGSFAYLTDCNRIPDASLALLQGLDTLILDGLRYDPHPTHFSLDEAVAIAKQLKPRITYLTHMNHDILHEEGNSKLPSEVRLGYDGLSFEFD